MFGRDTRIIALAHCVMNYAVKVKLEYIVQVLEARTSDITRDMQTSRFIQEYGLSKCCRYTRILKLFLTTMTWSLLLLSRAREVAAALT